MVSVITMKHKIKVMVDRPLGTEHPDWPGFVYQVNYGYVPGVMAPDGEEQDVYVLGVKEPLETFTGKIIAAVLRSDDNEDKLVAAPEEMTFSKEEIAEAIRFVEKYFDSEVVLYPE